MNIERGGEFVVVEIVAAEEEQLGLAGGKRCEHGTDAVLFFRGGVNLFGRGIAAHDGEEAFVAGAACLAAEFIKAKAYGGAIEPGFGLRRVGSWGAPQADEGFDGEFFGASGIADDSSNDARDAIESSAEERLDVERRGGRGCGFEDGFARCVHIDITTQEGDL